MSLEDFLGGAAPIDIVEIGTDRRLARAIQSRLAACHLLDPPADGLFGPVSNWALKEFAIRTGSDPSKLNLSLAARLLDPASESCFPIKVDKKAVDLASRIVCALQSKAYWICHHPDAVNIVYVEGMSVNGVRNNNAPNQFNDVRALVSIDEHGVPKLLGAWQATTEPGRFYTDHPMDNVPGAARIAFGQYKSWAVGVHRKDEPSQHEALVQVANIKIFRDLNKDYSRSGDLVYVNMFAINQHCAVNDPPVEDIGKNGAGCLVGRLKAEHLRFMQLCKKDPRYLVNNGYRFMSSILAASDL